MTDKTSQISVSISKETNEKLNAYCKKNGVRKNFVVERALSNYLDMIDEYDCETDSRDTGRDPKTMKL